MTPCPGALNVPGYGVTPCRMPQGHTGLCASASGDPDHPRTHVQRRWAHDTPNALPGTPNPTRRAE